MRSALGKGLAQLIGEQVEPGAVEVPVDAIVPNQRQPRTVFDGEAIQELASSISAVGVIQPLIVRPLSEGKYELIAGERRLRASRLAGLATVPVVVRSATNQNSLELAIIENVQREDISPLECARAYKALMLEFGLTQEQVAEKVGKSRAAIANTLRLLKLPEEILDGLAQGKITEGHARALLSSESEHRMLAIYQKTLERNLSVRDVEAMARSEAIVRPHVRNIRPRTVADVHTRSLEDAIATRLGAPAKIIRSGEGGKLELAFFSEDDLTRICEGLGIEL
jgi:ParB family chromosome partitioning protein